MKLVILKDCVTPFNHFTKGDSAPAAYWAHKFGKKVDIFLEEFNGGMLDDWFIKITDYKKLNEPIIVDGLENELAILFNHLEHNDDTEGAKMVEDIIKSYLYKENEQ